MVYSTLSADGVLDGTRRASIDDVVRRAGGRSVWRSSERASRTYALLELPEGYDVHAVRSASQAIVYDKAVIALALFPTLAEALPPLIEALAGDGRPAGVLACLPCPGGVVIEWDPDVTQAGVVLGIADVELQRFSSARAGELLSPLPPELVARVAAIGLQAPEIEPKRVLELRADRA